MSRLIIRYLIPLTILIGAGMVAHQDRALAASGGAEQVCGTLTADTNWSALEYEVNCLVTVPAGVTLTIGPGVTVRFDHLDDLTSSLAIYGTLIVNGSPVEPVRFTSILENPHPGDWDSLHFFPDSAGDIQNAIVEYGGRFTYGSIQVDGGQVAVRDSIIRASSAEGIRAKVWISLQNNQFLDNQANAFQLDLPLDTTSVVTISGNSGSGNQGNLLLLQGSVPASTTLGENPGLPYRIASSLVVPAGRTLSLDAGARFEMGAPGVVGGCLDVSGTLDANGTSAKPVILTSSMESTGGASPGDWYRINLKPGSTATLDYTQVRYGGAANSNLYAENASLTLDHAELAYGAQAGLLALDSAVSVTASSFHHNRGDGLRVVASAAAADPHLSANAFNNNTGNAVLLRFIAPTPSTLTALGNTGSANGVNAIAIEGSLADTTLGPNGNLVYMFQSLDIPAGVEIDLQAGAVVKLDSRLSNGGGLVTVNGILRANGVEGSPVVFTALKDDDYGGDTQNDGAAAQPAPGDWRNINVSSGGRLEASHLIVRYAGYDDVSAVRADGGIAILEEGAIIDNLAAGVTYLNSAPKLTKNVISRNGQAAVVARFDPGLISSLAVCGNSGEGNGRDGVQINGTLQSAYLCANEGLPYLVEALTIAKDGTVTVQPGAIFKLGRDLSPDGSSIMVYGSLYAQGTDAYPIIFTSFNDPYKGGGGGDLPPPAGDYFLYIPVSLHSSSAHTAIGAGNILPAAITGPLPGDWRGLIVGAGGRLVLEHVLVQYAGYPDIAQVQVLGGQAELDSVTVRNGLVNGIFVEDGEFSIRNSQVNDNGGFGLRLLSHTIAFTPDIVNNDFSRNATYGVYLIHNGGGLGTGQISGNTGAGNGLVNGIYLEGYVTTTDARLEPNPNFPYVIWTITVTEQSKLELFPGTVLKMTAPPDDPNFFARGTGCVINYGELAANGTPQSPVVFTSYWDDSAGGDTNGSFGGSIPLRGDWRGLINSRGGLLQMDYTQVRYGGSDETMIWVESGQANIDNASIEYSGGNGISGMGAISIYNSLIAHNARRGIQLSGPGEVHYNSLQQNGEYGLANYYNPTEDYRVPATNNFWGAASGPSYDGSACPFATPDGSGQTVNCRVAWEPYLSAPP